MATKRKTTSKTSGKKKRGRKPDAGSKSGQVRALLGSGLSAAAIAKKVGCTVGLVYNIKSTSGKSTSGAAKKRGPGRPRRSKTGSHTDLAGVLAAVQNSQRETAQLRGALERIQTMIGQILA